jgi:Family of unknown function (DUF1028)
MSKRRIASGWVSSVGIFLVAASTAQATYSVAACDAKTRECSVAVQTNNLAVGASVPYAQAGVGALVSQFETNPHYGPRGFALLAQGISPEDTLNQLLAEEGNFDGEGPEARQIALVSVDGRTAAHTGEEAQRSEWAGVRSWSARRAVGRSISICAWITRAILLATSRNCWTCNSRGNK